MKKDPYADAPEFCPELEGAITEFILHRKEMKKPMTARAELLFRRLLKKNLQEFHTIAELVEEIERAIMAGWQMVYPRTLSKQEQQHRWAQHPDLFYDHFTPEERSRLDTLLR